MAGAPSAECLTACKSRLVEFARSNTSGFVVHFDDTLKTMTTRFGQLRKALLQAASESSTSASATVIAAATRPFVVDVGSAGYARRWTSGGSDALLLLDVFAGCGGDIHAFEMQRDLTEQLAGWATMLLKKHQGTSSTFRAWPVALSDAPSAGHSVVGMSGTQWRNTYSLHSLKTAPEACGHCKRQIRNLSVEVTTLDLWATERRLSRPIFYIKIDTEGFEPQVLRGMRKLLRSPHAPLLISFEYAWGWSVEIARINRKRKACKRPESGGSRERFVPRHPGRCGGARGAKPPLCRRDARREWLRCLSAAYCGPPPRER